MASKKTVIKSETQQTEEVVIAYKGFDKHFQCRGFQYEVGKTYEMAGPIAACERGFHACENPFDVWSYYGPFESKFGVVEVSGKLSRHEQDSKIASAKLTVTAELTLPQFIQKSIEWIINCVKVNIDNVAENCKKNSGDSAQIGSSGYSAQIGSSGYSAKIGSSGDSAQIGSSGNSAQIGSSGDSAQIGSSGYSAKIGSSGYSAKIGSSGYSAKIGSSGDSAQIDASGKDSVVACAGSVYKFKLGKNGCAAIPFNDGTRPRFKTVYVGEDRIIANVWYKISDDGIVSEYEEE